MTRVIGLTAVTLTGNHGAEAMASSIAGRVRESAPGARLAIFTYYPQADKRVLADENAGIHSATPLRLLFAHLPGALLAALLPRRARTRWPIVPKEIRALAGCSVLVDMAGVSFIDGREKFLPFNILTILPAMLLGVPVVKASQAMGPFKNPVNRLAARLFLPRCRMIFARGARTLAHLEEMNLANIAPAPDAAFLLEASDRLAQPDRTALDPFLAGVEAAKAAGRRVIGVVPSSVVYAKAGEAYLDALARLIERAERDGALAAFIPNATRADDPDGLRNNDLPVIRKLIERLGPAPHGARPVIDGDIDAVSIKEAIAACDVMVVSRFHAMIGALSLAAPTLVFGWSHKYAEVMADFGMERLVFDYAAINADDIYPELVKMLGEREAISARISERLPAIRARARAQIDAIAALVD